MAPVSNGSKTRPLTSGARGPVHHWHTVGLDIPCPVARLQSRRLRDPGSGGFTSRSRAGLRLHPEVRHGAKRRRWCEWEQPHTLSWHSASVGDAEWMSGKSRFRLALVLTEASSWMSDRSMLGIWVCARSRWDRNAQKASGRQDGY